MGTLGAMQDWPLRIMRLMDHAEREHATREIVAARADGTTVRTNWKELAAKARRMAEALERLGVHAGDRVATLAMNHDRHLVAWFGVVGAGAVLHTVNPRLFDDQLTYIITHAEDRVLLYDAAFAPIIERLKPNLPTVEHFRRTDMAFALGYWHWFFLAQPYPLPEKMIGADPEWFFRHRPGRRSVFTPEAEEDYVRCYKNPETIHAACEDYRAAATYDFKLDEADFGRRKIGSPVLVLWGARGALPGWYDVLAVWREWADDLRGGPIQGGHFFPEEAPDETYAALRGFFTG